MILFPAIDIKDGKAVRLYQGRFDKCEEMGIPLEIAKEFEKTGAEFIHLVDLDGAKGFVIADILFIHAFSS